jgi:hypothetical protein
MWYIWLSIPLLALRMSLGILLRNPEDPMRQALDKPLSAAYIDIIAHLETLSRGYPFERHCRCGMIMKRAKILTATLRLYWNTPPNLAVGS